MIFVKNPVHSFNYVFISGLMLFFRWKVSQAVWDCMEEHPYKPDFEKVSMDSIFL